MRNLRIACNADDVSNSVADPYDPCVLCLPDPIPDPLVTSTDPDADPSIFKQK
jgi:hypothetical protein